MFGGMSPPIRPPILRHNSLCRGPVKFFPASGNFYDPFRGGDVDDREEISNASAVRKGEGYFTYAVHRVLYLRVHPVNLLTN